MRRVSQLSRRFTDLVEPVRGPVHHFLSAFLAGFVAPGFVSLGASLGV
jgi:hypothetical protein